MKQNPASSSPNLLLCPSQPDGASPEKEVNMVPYLIEA